MCLTFYSKWLLLPNLVIQRPASFIAPARLLEELVAHALLPLQRPELREGLPLRALRHRPGGGRLRTAQRRARLAAAARGLEC